MNILVFCFIIDECIVYVRVCSFGVIFLNGDCWLFFVFLVGCWFTMFYMVLPFILKRLLVCQWWKRHVSQFWQVFPLNKTFVVWESEGVGE